MHRFQRFAYYCVLLLSINALAGCAVKPYLMDRAADTLAVQGQSDEDDILLAREASAFYLKLSESVLKESPGNLKLAESVAAGFTQYAFAFVAFDAEKLESQDAKAAQRMRERAARLYLRANQHAAPAPCTTGAWHAAASWGGFISLSKDDPDKVADLPLAVNLAALAWKKNPDFNRGGLTSLMGTFEASRPGGSMVLAEKYFNQAIAQSKGESAGPWVAKAEVIALKKQDQKVFIQWLNEALQIAKTHRNLENEVMRERAMWLLDMVDDLF